MAEASTSAQKRAFKDSVVVLFMYLHTHAVELLCKCNITLVDVAISDAIASIVFQFNTL